MSRLAHSTRKAAAPLVVAAAVAALAVWRWAFRYQDATGDDVGLALAGAITASVALMLGAGLVLQMARTRHVHREAAVAFIIGAGATALLALLTWGADA